MGANLASEQEGVTVRVALKADDPVDRLRALKTADQTLERWLTEAIGEARRSGRSWAAIGEALGVTRQAAWQLYNADLRLGIDHARKRSGMSEDEAIAEATQQLQRVRHRGQPADPACGGSRSRERSSRSEARVRRE